MSSDANVVAIENRDDEILSLGVKIINDDDEGGRNATRPGIKNKTFDYAKYFPEMP